MKSSIILFGSIIFGIVLPTKAQVLPKDSLNLILNDTMSIKSQIANSAANVIQLETGKRITIGPEIEFVNYLISNELYPDARLAIQRLEEDIEQYSQEQQDSLIYLKGWLQYFSRNFEDAIGALRLVSEESELKNRSIIYVANCHAFLKQYDLAKLMLMEIDTIENPELERFINFELACLALMQRDYCSFEQLSSSFDFKDYSFADEESSLLAYYSQMSTYERKSPFLAGLYSALFPGMGKFYAGYKGIPFGMMSLVLPLAAITVETAIIGGITGPAFLIAAPIFLVFHISNIWGSALSVYAIQKEFYDKMDYNIMFDMHIPLRRVFN
ncbi:MAG: hypothetical protein R2813_14045 [Flavobacteriales bacterium]